MTGPILAPRYPTPGSIQRLAPVTLPVTQAAPVSETRYSPAATEIAGIYDAKGRLEPEPQSKAAQTAQNGWNREQAQLLQDLKSRDREVRQHEQAHSLTGGIHAGQMSLEYLQGPDGKAYANAGEVSIDLSPVRNDPVATIAKMQQVQAAALAPSEPSSQDRKVAGQAARLQRQAEQELNASRDLPLQNPKLNAYQNVGKVAPESRLQLWA